MSRRKESRNPTAWAWLGVLAALIAVGAVVVWVQSSGPAATAGAGPGLSAPAGGIAMARRETRPTLDPARFVGKAARAHQVAREIPDVLDRLYCYCECDKHLGHKSLLSCYTDSHAAT
jgi:hypothetical protein